MRKLFLLLCVIAAMLASPVGAGAKTVGSAVSDATTLAAVLAQNPGLSEDDDAAAVTALDISGLGLTDVSWLSAFTGLERLDMGGNGSLTTGADLTKLTALKSLRAAQCNLATLAATTKDKKAGLKLGSGNAGVTFLDLSGNTALSVTANIKYLTALDTLIMRGCTKMGSVDTGIGTALVNLSYLDMSQCGLSFMIMTAPGDNLRHLDLSGNPLLKGFVKGNDPNSSNHFVKMGSCQGLTWLDISGCTSWKKFDHLYQTYGCTSLDTLRCAGCSSLGWCEAGFESQAGLLYLDLTGCNISTSGTAVPDFSSLTRLQTLLYGENPGVAYLELRGCAELDTLDLHGDTGLAGLTLADCALPRGSLALIGGAECTALDTLRLDSNAYSAVADATADAAAWGLEGFRFLHLRDNALTGAAEVAAGDIGTLAGLDLCGNGGMTSLTAQGLPATLSALMAGECDALEVLRLNSCAGLTRTTADTVMAEGSGLFVLGCSALRTLDISGLSEDDPSAFTELGAGASLAGLDALTTLMARHGSLVTFTNARACEGVEGDTLASTLDDLAALEYLDLSHNCLRDSVHLCRNTALRHLDVSHNAVITDMGDMKYKDSDGEWLRPGDRDKAGDGLQAAQRNAASHASRYRWTYANGTNVEPYTNDRNDTTGLCWLDLERNTALEYLDISHTAISHTAAERAGVYNEGHVWLGTCRALEELRADGNGMRSLELGHLTGLRRLSAAGMRGADFQCMNGMLEPGETYGASLTYLNVSDSDLDSIGLRHLSAADTVIVSGNPVHYIDATPCKSLVYLDARGCTADTRRMAPDGFYQWNGTERVPCASIGAKAALSCDYEGYEPCSFPNGAAREVPSHYTEVSGLATEGYRRYVTDTIGGLRGLNCSGLPHLTTVLVDGDTELRHLCAHGDAALTGTNTAGAYRTGTHMEPAYHGADALVEVADTAGIRGLEGCVALERLWVNDNPAMRHLDVSANAALKWLHAYNDTVLGEGLPDGTLSLAANAALLSCRVSNSALRGLDVTGCAELDTLVCRANPLLGGATDGVLDLAENTALRHLDLAGCAVRSLGGHGVSAMTRLEFFDSSSDGGAERVGQPGRNTLTDLEFRSPALREVRCAHNDVFRLTGVDVPSLRSLHFPHNHVCHIDLGGNPLLLEAVPDSAESATGERGSYDCSHNGRGTFRGEMTAWTGADGEERCLYYLQLVEDAGDALPGNDTFLGHKAGADSLWLTDPLGRGVYERRLDDDGFDPARVAQFVTNAAGPYTAPSGAPRGAASVGTGDEIDTGAIIGSIAVLDKYDEERNYIEYEYADGRPDGATSTFYLVWTPPQEATAVDEADATPAPTVVSQRCYDAAGAEHAGPVRGVSIVVRRMSDGSTVIEKVVR